MKNFYETPSQSQRKNYAKNLYQISLIQDDHKFLLTCPCCSDLFIIPKIKGWPLEKGYLARHGRYKNNFDPVPPHLNTQAVEKLVEERKILGCGKLFLLKDKEITQIEP